MLINVSEVDLTSVTVPLVLTFGGMKHFFRKPIRSSTRLIAETLTRAPLELFAELKAGITQRASKLEGRSALSASTQFISPGQLALRP